MILVYLAHYGMMQEVQLIKHYLSQFELDQSLVKVDIVPCDVDWNKIKHDTILIGSHAKLARLPISRPIQVNGHSLCKVSALVPKWTDSYNQTLSHFKRGITIALKVMTGNPLFDLPVRVAPVDASRVVAYLQRHRGELIDTDFETVGFNPFVGEVVAVACWNRSLKSPCFVCHGDCQPVLEELVTEGHNLGGCNVKYENKWLLCKTGKEGNFVSDVQVTYALLYEENMKGLDFIAGSVDCYGYDLPMEEFLYPIKGLRKVDKKQQRHHHEAPAQLLTDYCAKDVIVTGTSEKKLLPLVFNSPGKMEDVRDWLVRGQACLARLEHRGMPLSKEQFDIEESYHLGRMEQIKGEIYEVAGKYMDNFDIKSSTKKAHLLYDCMGYPVMMTTGKGAKAKTGDWIHSSQYKKGWHGDMSPSAGADALELVREMEKSDPKRVKLLDNLIEFNQKQAVYDGLIKYCRDSLNEGNDCVRSNFSLTKLVTGQLSSSEPPLQNAVKDRIRRICKSRFKGGKILELDHSQLHLRIIGNLAQCEGFIDAYMGGVDLHNQVARDIVLKMKPEEYAKLKVKDEKRYEEARDKGKRTNFSIIFEIGKKALAFRLNVPVPTAAGYIDNWFAKFPEIEEQIERQHQFAIRNGYVVSPFGRVRHLPNAQSKDRNTQFRALRQSGDYLISNSGRYTTLYGMILYDEAMIKAKMQSYIFNQIHDSILIDTHPDEIDDVLELGRKHMVGDLIDMTYEWMNPIPFVVEGYWGDSWYKKDKEHEVVITKKEVVVK